MLPCQLDFNYYALQVTICEPFVINQSLRFALAGNTFNLEMECKCK